MNERMLSLTRDLLVTAFEGGSNYWYLIESRHVPKGTKFADFREDGRMQPKDIYYHWSQLIPTSGGSLKISVKDDFVPEGKRELFTLDMKALNKGWRLLRQKHPKIYWRIVKDEDFDAEDADVFLQLALFGDVVYG